MKYLITLITLTLMLSTQAFAGPGKKHHRTDSQLNHEQAIPGLSLEDDAILILTSPIQEEKALEEAAMNSENMTPSSLSNTEVHVSERAQNRLNKAEKRLNKKIDKLKKNPNRTLWDSAGTRWIILGLILLLVSVLFYILAIAAPPLAILGYLCSLACVVFIIIGIIVGLGGI